MIRLAELSDAAAITDIYNPYINDTTITFEEQTLSAAQIAQRLQDIHAAGLPWLVAQDAGQLVGYAYASPWKARSAYRHSVEVSVYLSAQAQGRGWGSRLYETLFGALKEGQVHVAIGGIALPNPASIALHEKFGMKQVAHFEQVGFKFGRWLDVGYWQKVL